ncbi:unnamed protein product [Hymenolepis diminuta]|uniref:Uncharacterized protein n=1 Tax=Hymenolepis diminuta TaxID=6216 RepID=A0A0R3SDD0_HYMDI|nr:unnamed protein product [Hymenolepis diminuta]VUZ40131.1 unnamed protein product [Hymenolepis diminuta]VUZ42132.1 unnamed protein product [Hymenolepis diminuta]VUZ42136.1 unnamed protein product [Hymenolepis diminuta]VUZ57448.1 unnamed protein product [Hymenolepis diminuta]
MLVSKSGCAIANIPFSVYNSIFQTENGSDEDLSGPMLPPSAVASRNSDDPARSSTRPLLWTPHKTSEKIQGGSNAQAYGEITFAERCWIRMSNFYQRNVNLTIYR